MPLWFARILAVALYTAMMAALSLVLKATVPGFNRWLGETFGQITSTLMVFGFFAACGIYGLWPRDAEGRMKPLRRPLSLRR